MPAYGTACSAIITSVERMIRNYVQSDGSGRLRRRCVLSSFLLRGRNYRAKLLTRERLPQRSVARRIASSDRLAGFSCPSIILVSLVRFEYISPLTPLSPFLSLGFLLRSAVSKGRTENRDRDRDIRKARVWGPGRVFLNKLDSNLRRRDPSEGIRAPYRRGPRVLRARVSDSRRRCLEWRRLLRD